MNRILDVFRNRNVEEEAKEDTYLNASFRDKNNEEKNQQDTPFWFMWFLCTPKDKAALVLALISATMLFAVIVCSLLPYPRTYWYPEYESASKLGKYKSAALSTDAAPCAAIGKDILKKSGTAVDAAIAVLLCLGVVNPQSSGIGGGFLMIYYNRTSKNTTSIDARERAPLKAKTGMFQGNESLGKLGVLAMAVPGEITGFEEAHERFGLLPWRDLFQPTIDLCRNGIPVTPHLVGALESKKEAFSQFQAIQKLFTNVKTGKFYQLGETYTRPLLANTLEIIAENVSHPTNGFYKPSPLSDTLLKELEDAGSIINKTDLNYYNVVKGIPIVKTLRNNLTLHTVPSPGTGALLAFVLGVLGGYDDFDPEVVWNRNATVRTLHRMIEAFKFAYGRRMEISHTYKRVVSEEEEDLISDNYTDKVRDIINDTKTFTDIDHYGVNVELQKDHGGAHVSIIAPNGDALSATSTINTDFGSMVILPSTGILMNNQMDAFNSVRRNRIYRGSRPFSSMSPSIITDSNGDVVMAIGGNGGTKMIASMAQVIFRTQWLKQNIKQAVDAPRFNHQLMPNYIEHEETFRKDLLEDLKEMGHEIHPSESGTLGNIKVVVRGKDQYLYTYSDYREGGNMDGF